MNAPAAPLVFRNGLVLTMDDRGTILNPGDVLVVGDRIAAVGQHLEAPEGATEIDASGGIVMPGMIDTHRHMWQTAMRGYGADWTLTQYFVWYYLQHGKLFRPEDIYAGNYLGAIEAIDAGVTTTVDWSHGLQTTQHADAAVDALQAVPGRFGRLRQHPAAALGWSTSRSSAIRQPPDHRRRYMRGSRSPSTSPPTPPSRRRPRSRWRDLGAGRACRCVGATNDNGIRLMHEHGFMGPTNITSTPPR
jgi:hypothetical protein